MATPKGIWAKQKSSSLPSERVNCDHIICGMVLPMLLPRREDILRGGSNSEFLFMINNVSGHSESVYHEIKMLILYLMINENMLLQFLDQIYSLCRCHIHLLLSDLLCSTVYVDFNLECWNHSLLLRHQSCNGWIKTTHCNSDVMLSMMFKTSWRLIEKLGNCSNRKTSWWRRTW